MQLSLKDTAGHSPCVAATTSFVSMWVEILLFLWNPSIRKFKMLPPLKNELGRRPLCIYSFGFDPFIHGYKTIVVSFGTDKCEVSVHTVGTKCWRRIQDFPYHFYSISRSGIFVGGTVNWLAYDAQTSYLLAIVSLNLEKESYQRLWQPCLKKHHYILGVLKDCLCMCESSISSIVKCVLKFGL